MAVLLPKRDGGDQSNGGPIPAGNDTYDAYNPPDGSGDGGWWWSTAGVAVRYTVVCLIFAAIILYFVGGYYHAQSRVRKGLPPRSYHAWMVRRYYRPGPEPYFQQQQQPGYAMPAYPPPPPAYHATSYAAPPPAYQLPEGASKALADQNLPGTQTHRAEEYGEGSQRVGAPTATARG